MVEVATEAAEINPVYIHSRLGQQKTRLSGFFCLSCETGPDYFSLVSL